MKAMFTVIKEQIQSFYLIRRLSVFEVKSENSQNYLGLLWEILNPLIQISIFWLVFGMGIRHGNNIDGIPFLPWMLSGIVVWFFANPAILNGSRSIRQRVNLVSKMSFPMSVIPSYVIFSKFYSHLVVLGLVIVVLSLFGIFPTFYIIGLLYAMFTLLALMIAISMVTSTLATVARDIQVMIQALMRLLMYTSPILWLPDEPLATIFKLNPLYYVVEVYRSSLLGKGWYFIEHPLYTLYFWIVVFLFLLFGSMMHVKLRDHFVEFI
ncbi:MAG TPA: ABC transporter permease [Bacillales bacterium]|nr:ABC transporter permease [Bacillales bacterium]